MEFMSVVLFDGTKMYFIDGKEVSRAHFQQMKEQAEKEEAENTPETVDHPAHYAEGRKFEPIDVIEDWGLGFCLGNAVKYISRAGRKEDYLNDLEKAKWYLEREIKKVHDGIKAKEEWDKMIEEERMSACENCGKCGTHD